MQTPPINSAARTKTPDLPLERLAKQTGLPREQRIAAAGRAFEAVFLRQILDSAQKTVIPSALHKESASAAVYRDLINDTLAQRIASSGQFGLASTLIADWNRSQPVSKDGAKDQPAEPLPQFAATPEAALAAAPAPAPVSASGPKPFRRTRDFTTGSHRSHLKPFHP